MYQEIIDHYHKMRHEERPPDGKFHPSSLTGCLRQAGYEKLGVPRTNPTDVRSMRIMQRGTKMHEDIQDWVKEWVPGFLPEVPVTWAGVIAGTCDGLLPLDDGSYELQEYKSISPLYTKVNRKNVLPKPEHVMQARIYYAALRTAGEFWNNLEQRTDPLRLAPSIRIVYFDRDDWKATECEVEPWDAYEAEAFLVQLNDLEWNLSEGTLPERKPEGYWLCRYCPWQKRCWDIDGEYELWESQE